VEAGDFDVEFVKRQGIDPVLFDRKKHTEEEANGTIGCFLSHTLALLQARKDLAPDDLLLMMEDDIVIPADWRLRMQAAVDQAPKDWQLLKLSGWGTARAQDLVSRPKSWFDNAMQLVRTSLHPFSPQAPQFSVYQMKGPFVEPSTWSWLTGSPYFFYAGTGAYLVRGSEIQAVLDHLRSQPINDLDAMLLSRNLRFYEAWPHVFDLAYEAFNGIGLHGSKAMDEGGDSSTWTVRPSSRMSRGEPGASMSIGVSAKAMQVLRSDQNDTIVELNSGTRRAPIRMHSHSMSAGSDTDAPVSVAQDPKQAKYGHPLWLKDCASIYLDVGSNIGVQVRKLFEPERYPEAPLLQVFDQLFGAPEDRSLPAEQTGLCALGLEPNPQHKAHLRRLEEKYAARGWRAHFYPFAAWKDEGFMLFDEALNSTFGDYEAKLVPAVHNANATVVQVRTVNLGEFIKSLPPHSVKLLKVDIGGAEYQTAMRMIEERVLCEGTVDAASIKVHNNGDITNWQDDRSPEALSRQVSKTKCGPGGAITTLIDASDEMYFTDEPEKDIAERKAEDDRLDHDRFVKRCYMVLILVGVLLLGGAGYHFHSKTEASKAERMRDSRLARYSFVSAQPSTSSRC
jgi:GR25 family glycosyltransferase involved in LPS biosynthesis